MDFQHHVGTGITPSAEVWLPKEARGLEDAEIVICSEPMWLCAYIRPRTAGVLGDVGEVTWFFEVGAAQTPLLPLQRSHSLTLPTASLLFPWTPHAIPYLHVHTHSTSPKRFKPLPVETDGFLVNLSDTVCSATWLKLLLLIIDRIHSLSKTQFTSLQICRWKHDWTFRIPLAKLWWPESPGRGGHPWMRRTSAMLGVLHMALLNEFPCWKRLAFRAGPIYTPCLRARFQTGSHVVGFWEIPAHAALRRKCPLLIVTMSLWMASLTKIRTSKSPSEAERGNHNQYGTKWTLVGW